LQSFLNSEGPLSPKQGGGGQKRWGKHFGFKHCPQLGQKLGTLEEGEAGAGSEAGGLALRGGRAGAGSGLLVVVASRSFAHGTTLG